VHAESVDYGGGISITMRNVREYPMYTEHTMAALRLVLQILKLQHFSYTLAVVGIPAILQSMAHDSNAPNAGLQLLGCRALSQLVETEQDCVALLGNSGIEVMLMTVLARHAGDPAIAAQAVITLARVAGFKCGGRAIVHGNGKKQALHQDGDDGDDGDGGEEGGGGGGGGFGSTDGSTASISEASAGGDASAADGHGQGGLGLGVALLTPLAGLGSHCADPTYVQSVLQLVCTLVVNDSADFRGASAWVEAPTIAAICWCLRTS
jgi:hypothetical protein